MARVDITQDNRSLDDLIVSFYQNKSELDSYKKICEDENTKIKTKMTEISTDTYEVNGIVAKISYKDKSTFNDAKLLATVKELGLDVVRTREYVDMDLLENVLYSDSVSKEDKQKLLACKESKIEKALKVTRKKEKE